jgi:hypothetical protein
MRFLELSLLSAVASIASAQYPGAVPPPDSYKKGFDSITQKEARDYLTFLSTKCEGRGTGQPGFQKAADYVAAHFKSFGLKPMGDNGTFFQSTTFYRSRTDPASASVDLGGKVLASGNEIQVTSRTGVDFTGPLVLLRAAGPDAKLPDNDALKNKVVIVDFPGITRRFRSQLFLAGATGIVTIRPKMGAPSWDVFQKLPSNTTAPSGEAVISKDACQRILNAVTHGSGKTLDTPVAPSSVSIVDLPGAPLHLVAKKEVEEVKVPNVVGLIEGTDPTLKAEVVGIGGHLDHLGIRGNVVYPGADDDGSGSTAVLCIAKALSVNREKPKRSILLMTFFGEELGLLGSAFLAEHPPVPLANMVSELQMDMVARDSYGPQNNDPKRMDKLEENIDTMRLVGSKRISTELDKIIQEQNKSIGFKFKYDAEDVYTRSDHYNFAKHGVPISFLFDGFTPDYHQPTDTIEKIDFLKLTNAAKLYYLTAMTIANLDHRPVHDVQQ